MAAVIVLLLLVGRETGGMPMWNAEGCTLIVLYELSAFHGNEAVNRRGQLL